MKPDRRQRGPRPSVLMLALGLLLFPAARLDPAPKAFADLDAVIASGVSRGIYPGAVVIVGRQNSILHARGFGRFSWSGGSRFPNPDSTLYDLASLTKVVATTSAAMLLVDRGRLALDSPVSTYLPRFNRPSQRAITIRMLLDHTSGLKPYVEFYKRSRTRSGIVSLVFREEPIRVPGESAVYSDINAMLLGLVVEGITGESLDRFVRRELFLPLGMTETGFNPSASARRRAAPSYADRRTTIAGVVHDRNARDLGGVAGHAGLFSTAADLARFAQWWLAAGRANGTPLVAPSVVHSFLEHRDASGTRLLGWDSPDPDVEGGSVFGSLLSGSAYGHTGWTGTQIWVDPEKDLFVVLLTNRSLNPRVGRSLRDLRVVRAQVADAAVTGAFTACQSQHSTC
jgi:CubicO group peptidase (beta-lactamase class C family)